MPCAHQGDRPPHDPAVDRGCETVPLGVLEKRNGPKVIDTLVMAIAKPEKDIQATAQTLLLRHLSRMSVAALKNKLQDERPEVRAAVLVVTSGRKLEIYKRTTHASLRTMQQASDGERDGDFRREAA